jgi:hypothetical protein
MKKWNTIWRLFLNKERRQKRFQQKHRHIERQLFIYDMVMGPYKKWIPDNTTKMAGKDYEKTPHRFHKKNALNCGDPKCVMCMNPRKAWGKKTRQEEKFECSAVEQIKRNPIGKWEWEDLNDPNMEWW